MFAATRTPSDVVVTILDLTATLAGAQTFIAEHKGADYVASFAFAPYGFAMSADGQRYYVICSEGVGWEITEDKPLSLDVYAAQPEHMAILPSATLTMSPREVLEAANGGTTVPLHDHIRSFGARLDDNYAAWVRRLTADA